jgi:superfamily II DNA/RNA helicase
MLDMGFIPDVERIVSLLPKIRQTLFFSATLDKSIRKLADSFLMNPKEISVAPSASTADTVTQNLIYTQTKQKREVLRILLDKEAITNAVIFCNRKRDIGVLHRSLTKHGYDAVELHGDLPQTARTETLAKFKNGDFKLLIASDVAARGLDIEGLSHVFNFDVPTNAEDYVHRIGRTGRAGKEGRAFTLAVPEDEKYIQAIIKLTKKAINVVHLDLESQINGKNPTLTNQVSLKTKSAPPRGKDKQFKQRNFDKKPRASTNNYGEQVPPPVSPNSSKVGMGDHVPAFLLR